MTKQERIEKVVDTIYFYYRDIMVSDTYYANIESWAEMIKMFGYSSKELKDEVRDVLFDSEVYEYIDDDEALTISGDLPYCEDDVAYRDYMRLVRKEMNKWFKERNGK